MKPMLQEISRNYQRQSLDIKQPPVSKSIEVSVGPLQSQFSMSREISYFNIDSTNLEGRPHFKQSSIMASKVTPSKPMVQRIHPYDSIFQVRHPSTHDHSASSLPQVRGSVQVDSLKLLNVDQSDYSVQSSNTKNKRTLLTRVRAIKDDADNTTDTSGGMGEYASHLLSKQSSVSKQQMFIKKLKTFKDMIQTQIKDDPQSIVNTSSIAQAANIKEYEQKQYMKELTSLKRWIHDQQFDIEYTGTQCSEKEIYMKALYTLANKVFQKNARVKEIVEMIYIGLSSAIEKEKINNDQITFTLSKQVQQLEQKLQDLNVANQQLETKISKEKNYLDTLFFHISKSKLQVDDFENSKSIATLIQEQGISQDQEEYSGLSFFLNDIYSELKHDDLMNSHLSQANILSGVNGVIQDVQSDLISKVRGVQNATALKVLSRFYKKIDTQDSSTQVEVDHVELERARLQRLVDKAQEARAEDKGKIEQLEQTVQSNNKQLSTVFTQLREKQQESSNLEDALQKEEAKLKVALTEMRNSRDEAARYESQKRELQDSLSEVEAKLSNQIATNNKVQQQYNQLISENRQMEVENIQLQRVKKQLLETVNQLEQKVNEKKNQKKIPLLVRRPIYDEMKKSLGEAYIEEMITMRSDVEYDLFGSSEQYVEDHTSISQEDIVEFKQYLAENGQTQQIASLENIQNIQELRAQINNWFKFEDSSNAKFENKVKQIQHMQRFFLRMKNQKNNIVNLEPAQATKQIIQKKKTYRKPVNVATKIESEEEETQVKDSGKRLSQKYNSGDRGSRLDSGSPYKAPLQSKTINHQNSYEQSERVQIQLEDARKTQRTTHRMATPDIMREIIAADEKQQTTLNMDLYSSNRQTRMTRTKYKIIQPSYIQLTRNKLNNPELFIDQPILQSIYYRRSLSPVVQGNKKQIRMTSMDMQTDPIDLLAIDKPSMREEYVQTDPMAPTPDDELKRKLLEFIGGKLAKQGDNFDKGSSFFTHASHFLSEELLDSIHQRKPRVGLGNLRIRSYEPILSKKQ
ncbi:hypothetical protein FGO68_gene2407 [Halteria grandinella]|uniref:Uncharacterized protein n=1 Tax=Halteria grandinella TaxID=5974 RepID=A0A8J8NZI2_HALGN|nr:hypothetical protein FGO68_gene2407 [Halteria grandinella]